MAASRRQMLLKSDSQMYGGCAPNAVMNGKHLQTTEAKALDAHAVVAEYLKLVSTISKRYIQISRQNGTMKEMAR